MKVTKLYRYRGENGVVDTTVLLPMAHEDRFRLDADEGMALTDGETVHSVIDIPAADLEMWSEIEAPDLTEDGEGVCQ